MLQSFLSKRTKQDRQDSHSSSVNLELDEWLRMRGAAVLGDRGLWLSTFRLAQLSAALRMNFVGIVVISEKRSRMAGCFKDCIQRVAARKRRGRPPRRAA